MASRAEEKERRRQERLAGERAAAGAAQRRRRLQMGGLAAVAVAVVVGVVIAVAGGSGSSHSSSGPNPSSGGALLASTASEATGQPVDGVQCQTSEQVIFHIHAHLAVFVNGAAKIIPYGIGIPPPRQVEQTQAGPFVLSGACFYWLHSHTEDGIIHIESPIQRVYTLGNYFDLWGQPLGPTQVGPASGPVSAFVNGQPYTRDPRSIPLTAHAVVQLDVGTPKPAPAPFTFAGGL
ncbi:MAG TPA: hypothetical protein VGY97_00055 [Solirubrobacteraceae bacterium]|nr:hypothetical protein [Solirubrobacteraceae bacterium]